MIATSRKRCMMATAAKVVLSAAAVILVVRNGEVPPDRTDPGCACYRGDAHRAGGWRTLPGWMLINRVLRAEVARAQVPSAELTAEEVVRPPLWPDPPLTVRPYWGLSFDGTDDYGSAPNSTSLNITGSLTIEAWVEPTGSSAANGGIVDRGGGRQYALAIANTNLYFLLSQNGSDQFYRYASPTVPANSWTHVAGVYDASAQTMTVYLNGSIPSSTLSGTVGNSLYSQTASFYIGRRLQTGQYFKGVITQLRVWNVVRTQAQVQMDMVTPFIGPTAGLVLEYPMLPGSGQTLTDYSGTGNNGTLGSSAGIDTNDPQWTGPYRGLAGGPLQ